LHLLFEDRLKMSLFRPIGLEWFQKGFWKIAEPYHNAPDTIDQFLGIPRETWDANKEPTQRYGQAQLIDGVYHIPVKVGSGEYIQKAITFDKFLEMDFDFIVASYGGHESAYGELVRQHKPNAIYIRQIGNAFEYPHSTKNALVAGYWPMPFGVNYITYHPEHHRDYCYAPPTNHNTIKSFIAAPLAEPDLPLFYEYERILHDYTFKMHGILGRDGVISGDLMPQTIKDSAFVWHVKRWGCCGFVSRQALACGRPCIIKKSYCAEFHALARDLYEDSVNCIDLDAGSLRENIEKIRYFSQPERHIEMCRATADKFKKDVNFEGEAKDIGQFLDSLKRD